MIATVSGLLMERDGEAVVIQTDGGVGYEITVPLGTLERLPAVGQIVNLYTELVVREDAWSLYGFDRRGDRTVFQRLLGASGFGPKLALALISTLGAGRTVRSIRQNDLAALSSVSGIGKKKAERLVLELRDRFEDLESHDPHPLEAAPSPPAEAAVKALVRLGYAPAAAEEAVRDALTGTDDGDTALLVRRALQRLAPTRGGR